MRRQNPLIIGAGPAGCAAAIRLRQSGFNSLLLDRDEEVGDPLCGGFLSWRTAKQLAALDIDLPSLGAHRVDQLRVFNGDSEVTTPLPHTAFGLSRHALDTAMRAKAIALGAEMAVDAITGIEGTQAVGKARKWQGSALFLATGKHDIRGQTRPRNARDTALGLRLRLPASPQQTSLLTGAIELHLFRGGYAGIVLQEGNSVNICLALRKSALADADRSPQSLFAWLAERSGAFAQRLGEGWQSARIGTIGAVPYGFIAQDTEDDIYRLGDQAAVIPSLAGEGISIALASGVYAASFYGQGRDAHDYQAHFARQARRPIRLASTLWHTAETRLGARAGVAFARVAPAVLTGFAGQLRIDPPPSLAHPASPA